MSATGTVPFADKEGMVLVQLPSQATFPVHEQEVNWFIERCELYLKQNHFVNISDLSDVDRMMILELMVYRWGTWLSQQKDWWGGSIDPNETQKAFKEYCVTPDTEALTKQGWRRWDQLVVGQEILTLDHETGASRWQPVRAVNVFDGTRSMRSLDCLWHHSCSTADHRWWTRRVGRNDQERFTTTAELDVYDRVPMAAPHMDFPESPKFSDTFVEMVAWWWTEGSCTRPNMINGEIGQSASANPSKVSRIRKALTAEFGKPGPMQRGMRVQPVNHWNETRRRPSESSPSDEDFVLFNLGVQVTEVLEEQAPNQMVSPAFLLALTEAQLGLFIDVSVMADGSHQRYPTVAGDQRHSTCITQAREANLRAFEVACALAGRATHTYQTPSGQWNTSIMRKNYCAPAMGDSTWDHFTGTVWCPTVDDGLWLARRDGTVFYNGNSNELRQLKKLLGIDKAARDKMRGDDSVSAYLAKLQERANEFGIMREGQLAKGLELFNQMKALVTLHFNCLAGDTEIITDGGVERIGSLAGRTASILNGDGGYQDAEIRSFGQQRLCEIRLSRWRTEKIVLATAGHRWFVRGRNRTRTETITGQLQPGDHLVSVFGHLPGNVEPSPFGIPAGIVFGDGTVSLGQVGSGSSVTLCGEKDEVLLDWFPLSKRHSVKSGDGTTVGVQVVDLPRSWKDTVPMTEGLSYLYGWLAGYFAADGTIDDRGASSITSRDRWRLEAARDVAYRLGFPTLGITEWTGISPYLEDPVTTYRLNFPIGGLPSDFFLIPAHRARAVARPRLRTAVLPDWKVVSVKDAGYSAEVFCAVVPGSRSFTLADNLLTGNCDEIERREMHVNAEDVLEWLREVAVPEYDAIDEYFRQHQQKTWIRKM